MTTRIIPRLGLAVVLICCASTNAWAQTDVPDPASQENTVAAQPSEQTQSTQGPDPAAKTQDKDKDNAAKTQDKDDAAKMQDKDKQGKPKKPKRGSLVIAPIPISSPAVGSGLVVAVGYVFKLNEEDKLSPPSTVGVVGASTNGGSRGGLLGGRLYFSENKYQTTFVLAKGHVNFDFFGIGRIPGREPVSVPIQVGGTVFFGEFLRNVWKDVFVGPRFQYRKLNISLDGPQTPGGFEIPSIDFRSKSVALGVHLQRDKRDSTFYPRKGSLFDVSADFFDQSLGSRRQYQTYKVAYNAYREVGENQVLAYRGMVCSANQNVPFYDLVTPATLKGYA